MAAAFEDQVAIVTGAAGGIGSAVVRRLLRDAARVALVDIDASHLESVVAALEVEPSRVLSIPADVTQEADVQRYVRQTLECFGRLDLFFNNAGIEGRIVHIVDADVSDFDQVIGVNARGVFLGLREVLRAFRQQGSGGAIVNTASIAGLHGGRGNAAYVASKHAVIGLTRCAALEAASLGVRVNAIAPGFIDTRMVRALHEALSPNDPNASRQEFEARVPLRRYGTPDEVANLVAWLLSKESTYITGSVHQIDAGLMA